jgi:hypothetical protein
MMYKEQEITSRLADYALELCHKENIEPLSINPIIETIIYAGCDYVFSAFEKGKLDQNTFEEIIETLSHRETLNLTTKITNPETWYFIDKIVDLPYKTTSYFLPISGSFSVYLNSLSDENFSRFKKRLAGYDHFLFTDGENFMKFMKTPSLSFLKDDNIKTGFSKERLKIIRDSTAQALYREKESQEYLIENDIRALIKNIDLPILDKRMKVEIDADMFYQKDVRDFFELGEIKISEKEFNFLRKIQLNATRPFDNFGMDIKYPQFQQDEIDILNDIKEFNGSLKEFLSEEKIKLIEDVFRLNQIKPKVKQKTLNSI